MRPPVRRLARVSVFAVAWPAGLLASSGGACAPSSSGPAAEGADAYAPCPDTLAETVGAACPIEGAICSPSYTCGITFVLAYCTCTAGAYACSDYSDASIAGPDAQPGCPSPVADQPCPPSEDLASGALCVTAGLMCTYPSPCDATLGIDTCECDSETPPPSLGSSSGGATLFRFECTSQCTYAGPLYVPDAGDDASAPPGSGGPDQSTPVLAEAAPDAPVDSDVSEAAE